MRSFEVRFFEVRSFEMRFLEAKQVSPDTTLASIATVYIASRLRFIPPAEDTSG